MPYPHPLKTVVLDDDPTGTQSASDVTVLLDWDVALAKQVLRSHESMYVLTNTRALPEAEAVRLLMRIREDIDALAERSGFEVQFVLRGDSTLRGHVFAESEVFMDDESILVFVPAFPAGGRVTMKGRHYVTQHRQLVPAHLTEYARDPVFPFDTSDLREYVHAGSGRSSRLLSEAEASGGADALARELRSLPSGTVALFDASDDAELRVLADAIRNARSDGKQIVVRSASPLAAQLANVESSGLLEKVPQPVDTESLIVCGSHTSGATAQLTTLEGSLGLPTEINTDSALRNPATEGHRVARLAARALDEDDIAMISTSRERRADHDSLDHGASIMSALTTAVADLAPRVGLVVAKGGITSAEVARAGLGARIATVIGQVLPGVSLWLLHKRNEEEALYVVVPGNVGEPDTIARVLSVMGETRAT